MKIGTFTQEESNSSPPTLTTRTHAAPMRAHAPNFSAGARIAVYHWRPSGRSTWRPGLRDFRGNTGRQV